MEKGKDLIFTATVAEKPEVKLGKYKGVSVEKVEYKVTAEDVEKSLTAKQEQNSRIVSVTDRAVETKDITVIDFDGSVDGVHFEGGKAEKYELEIGSNSFIPGFEDQIIGMKIDEEKDIFTTASLSINHLFVVNIVPSYFHPLKIYPSLVGISNS